MPVFSRDDPKYVDQLLDARFSKRGVVSGDVTVGLLAHGIDSWDMSCASLAASMLGGTLVRAEWQTPSASSLDELVIETELVANAVDLLLVAFVDMETFGAGASVLEEIAQGSPTKILSLRDEVYSDFSALAHLSLLKERTGSLKNGRIVISWAFGERFPPPSTVHSLLLIGSALGAEISVTAPPRFEPLKRVVRHADSLAGSVTVVTCNEMPPLDNDVSAVIALNWSSLDEFGDIERNRDIALKHRDWFFDETSLPSGTLFLTEPPIRTEMVASTRLLRSKANLTPLWLRRRAEILAAAMRGILEEPRGTDSQHF